MIKNLHTLLKERCKISNGHFVFNTIIAVSSIFDCLREPPTFSRYSFLWIVDSAEHSLGTQMCFFLFLYFLVFVFSDIQSTINDRIYIDKDVNLVTHGEVCNRQPPFEEKSYVMLIKDGMFWRKYHYLTLMLYKALKNVYP